jgi:DNA-binding NtrC family response regulator
MTSTTKGATEVVFARDREVALVQQFRLVVVGAADPADANATHQSKGDRVVIGTDESANLALKDRTVSRFHCEIVIAEGRPVVRDLGSRNGVIVDGVPVLEAPLRQSATLTLGRTQVRFEMGNDRVQVPLSSRERFGVMVGRSVPMRAVFAVLERAAAGDATVLLGGETGTGKEAASESIHRESARAEKPFLVVDCGAIPPNLLESELFGHKRGSFTGATGDREGAFEAANGGTIFLDEIGELSLDLQPKLLRALDKREVKPVGSNKPVPIDVRVIAATNRNLQTEVNAGKFRADLYYRLAVLEVRLPSLRERTEDIPLLVEHILENLGASDRDEAAPIRAPEFQAHLAQHGWPGNVRELRNYIERSLALQAPPPGGPGPAPAYLDQTRPLRVAREAWIRAFERGYLEDLLKKHDNNVTAAARAAGVDRIHFYRLLWKHNLR